MRNTTRQVKALLYRLKRNFGIPAAIYKPTGTSVDYKTGVTTRGMTKIPVAKIVVLPDRERKQVSDLVSGDFSFGGYFGTNERVALIDFDDVGTEIAKRDYIHTDGQSYVVTDINRVTEIGSYLIKIESTNFDPPKGEAESYIAEDIETIVDATEEIE